eukprot:2074360-Amphidinium_carterae.1
MASCVSRVAEEEGCHSTSGFRALQVQAWFVNEAEYGVLSAQPLRFNWAREALPQVRTSVARPKALGFLSGRCCSALRFVAVHYGERLAALEVCVCARSSRTAYPSGVLCPVLSYLGHGPTKRWKWEVHLREHTLHFSADCQEAEARRLEHEHFTRGVQVCGTLFSSATCRAVLS